MGTDFCITDSTDRKPLWNKNVPVPGFTVTSKFYCIKWILKKEAVNMGAGFNWLQVWFQWQAFVMIVKTIQVLYQQGISWSF